MLGRSERESGAHALEAARLGGWDAAEGNDGVEDVLDLGAMSATLATVARIEGMLGVMHIGHPAQPDHDLERALLASAPSVRVTAAVAVPSQWVWVSRAAEASGQVVVDEAAMRDCRHALRSMGAAPHLVPARTGLAERVAMAGETGSLVVERPLVPEAFHELPGSERLGARAPLWYGLVESVSVPADFDVPAQVWLAFGPREDHRGSLQRSLELIADAGINLQHLRSQQSADGPHAFFAAFRCPSSTVLRGLRADLGRDGIAHRVLAVLPGHEFAPGPDAIQPRWAPAL